MGKFKCSCGYLLGVEPVEPGTAFWLIPDELIEDLGANISTSPFLAARGQLHHCPNCDRLHLENQSGIRGFVAERFPPRIWADLNDRDELGRVRLVDPRSLTDIQQQKLILNSPLEVMLYQDDGSSVIGEANYGLNAAGDLDPSVWAVVVDREL